MAIDFPNSPTVGDTYTTGGRTWQWDGTTWKSYGNYPDPTVLKIDPATNRVGINNTSPTVALDVTGNVNISGELTSRGYRYVQTVYFTSNGTFTKATYPWLRAIRVTVVGGGGGGGGAGATGAGESSEGAGGAGGGYAIKFITDIAGLSASETITVGAGGSGGAAGANDGANGGTTAAFGLTGGLGFKGDGGSATSTNTYAFGRSSTIGSGGDINGRGDYGGAGIVTSFQRVGLNNHGGGTILTGVVNVASSYTDGFDAAANTGGGGSGGRNRLQSATAKAGGGGADGIVIVELYA